MTVTDALLIAYAALVLLAALALVASRWPWPVKGLLVAATLGLYLNAEQVLQDVWGWAAPAQPLPPRFVLLASVIEEPSANSAGALYLWVNAIEGGKTLAAPRAYRLPYAKDLHAMLGEAAKKQRQGVSQMGSAVPKSGPKGFSWLRPGADEQDVKIRDLPVPQLPEK